MNVHEYDRHKYSKFEGIIYIYQSITSPFTSEMDYNMQYHLVGGFKHEFYFP